MCFSVWLLFSAFFLALTLLSHGYIICHGIVGLTFVVFVPSACNLTDQRTEAHQSVFTENYLLKTRRIIKVLLLKPALFSLFLPLRQSILIMIYVTVQLLPFEFTFTTAALQRGIREQSGNKTVEPKSTENLPFLATLAVWL